MSNINYEEDISLVKRRRSNRKKSIILVISLFAVLCGIVAFFILNNFYKKTNTVSFDNYDVYQYFSGIKYNYIGQAVYENGKIISVNDSGNEVEIGDTPIYFQSVDNECIIPVTMGLFFINEKGKNYRVNYFTKLVMEMTNNEVTSLLSYNNQRKVIEDAFLYDGKDMYVFPYAVKLIVEDKTYDLSPLSYVIVNYKDSVEIYNKEKDEYTFIEKTEKDVIATYNDNKINLSTDMIMYEDDERLLIKNVGKLNIYE